MHQVIQDGLEDFLVGASSGEARARIQAHLASCQACRRELDQMRELSGLFRSLRSEAAVTPAPGFYARVAGRIEDQERSSIWMALLEPAFARRIAFASLVLLAMLGSLMVSRETEYYAETPTPEMVLAVDNEMPDLARDPARDRMLVTLASYK